MERQKKKNSRKNGFLMAKGHKNFRTVGEFCSVTKLSVGEREKTLGGGRRVGRLELGKTPSGTLHSRQPAQTQCTWCAHSERVCTCAEKAEGDREREKDKASGARECLETRGESGKMRVSKKG